MAVVKANAYGHGLLPVARAVLKAGGSRLAVNRLSEGVELRQAGVTAPILILGHTPASDMPQIVRHRLVPTVTEPDQLEPLDRAASRAGQLQPIHVKVDTGMGRLGVLPAEVEKFAARAAERQNLHLEGLYSHLAVADSSDADDKAYTRRQLDSFERVLTKLRQAGHQISLPHIANAAATVYFPQSRYQLVRPGLILYGLKPNHGRDLPIDVKPALSLISYVARVKKLAAGKDVSYGRTFTTSQPTTAALVPVGYGDGYHRGLSNKGQVLVGGRRAPIIGRVCMDQLVVDVTDIPGVKLEDEVVLLGSQRDGSISASDIADWMGEINYVVTTALLERIPRVYLG